MGAAQPLLEPRVDVTPTTEGTEQARHEWNVVVWNDPVTPMTVVVVILRRIFGYSNNKCTQLMLAVHHEGRAVVWTGALDRAESYCVKLQAAGLNASIESTT